MCERFVLRVSWLLQMLRQFPLASRWIYVRSAQMQEEIDPSSVLLGSDSVSALTIPRTGMCVDNVCVNGLYCAYLGYYRCCVNFLLHLGGSMLDLPRCKRKLTQHSIVGVRLCRHPVYSEPLLPTAGK
jgi:hypothetical protein